MLNEVGDEIAAPVLVDRHPTTLIAPDGRSWVKVRVIVTPDGTYAYGERYDAATGRRLVSTVARVPHRSIRPDGDRWLLDADDGLWTLMPESGCRCGSGLGHLPIPVPAVLTDYPA